MRRAGALLLCLALGGALAPGQEESPGPAREESTAPAPEGSPEPDPDREAVTPPAGDLQVRWQPWGRATFETAARLRRPVLLYLRATDCRLCVELEETVLTRQDLVRAISEDTVPVAVDADVRPDLAARYVQGMVPTLTFLLPNGEPMYNVEDPASLERIGGYFTSAVELHSYLDQTVAYFQRRGRDLAAKAREVAALQAEVRDYQAGPPPLARMDEVLARVREGLDASHGGFGRTWKIIADDPYRVFRMQAARGSEPALTRALITTAEKMLAGAIHDQVEGGFHHFATTRDWGVPALEKRLTANARALRLLTAAAAQEPERRDLRQAVASTADFLLRVLRQPDGGFAFSQLGFLEPGDPGAYFKADAEERRSLRPPALDLRQMAPGLAGAAVALLEAGALLERTDLEEAGLAAVDRLAAGFYRSGRGLAHILDADAKPQLEGLLLDQVAGLEAFLAAAQVRSGQDLERARDLFQFCEANLRRGAGYFVDRVDDRLAVGMLRRPLVSYADNGRLAVAAYRLAALTGEGRYRTVGDAVLGALARAIPKMDWQDAPYLEALLAAQRPPTRIVVSRRDGSDPGGLALARAARLLPVPGLVVLPGGPGPLEAKLALPGKGRAPGAYPSLGEACLGPVARPRDLLAALESLAETPAAREAGLGEAAAGR